jgi:hypothetical protein
MAIASGVMLRTYVRRLGATATSSPEGPVAAVAMIRASTFARRVGDREFLSVSEKRSSMPSSKAVTTVSCT